MMYILGGLLMFNKKKDKFGIQLEAIAENLSTHLLNLEKWILTLTSI